MNEQFDIRTATKQQAFDFAVAAMRKQKAPSATLKPGIGGVSRVACIYGTSTSAKRCAIGHMIPAEFDGSIGKNEGVTASELLSRLGIPLRGDSAMGYFLDSLQEVHDGSAQLAGSTIARRGEEFLSRFEVGAERFASQHRVAYTPPAA